MTPGDDQVREDPRVGDAAAQEDVDAAAAEKRKVGEAASASHDVDELNGGDMVAKMAQ